MDARVSISRPFILSKTGGNTMALKLSTGLRNFLVGGGSLRKAFEDGILNIYSGPIPASADDDDTGVLLVPITLASGAVTAGTRSTPDRWAVTVPDNVNSHTYKLRIAVGGVNHDFIVTNPASAPAYRDVIAEQMALLINDDPQFQAIAATHGTDAGLILIQCRIAGLVITITDNNGTSTFISLVNTQAGSPINSLKLGVPALGVISKVGVWSGEMNYSGTAGYFRLVTTRDGADLDSDYSDYRIQGNVSTSGAELNLSNINLVAEATETISTFTLTEPASAA